MSDVKLNIIINAKDNASGVLKGLKGGFGGLSAGIKTAGMIGVGALGAAGVAATTFAVKSIGAFSDFDQGMREVFTLLPGLSEEAMGTLSQDVLNFNTDMGRLSEETIPALYQSLSAGVPQDNVFEFLEVAHMAAVGGVAELDTAVDGITSVVNAYGKDVMEATRASDVMFTAVKLGKTDFNQLSASLFNVIPTASSLGVQFEDVAAAMAVMTAQGTPTSVATTQLRGLMVEASKGGSKLDNVIRDLSGVGFADLIAQGENVGSIMSMVREELGDEQFRNTFGSVEALNAALAISGPNADGFADALDEMNNAAGATETAFNTVDQGLAPFMDRLNALKEKGIISLGRALQPLVDKFIDWADKVMPKIDEKIKQFTPIIENIVAAFGNFFSRMENGAPILGNLFGLVQQVGVALGVPQETLSKWAQDFNYFNNTIIPMFQQKVAEIWAVVQPFVDQVVVAITSFVSWKDVLIALGVVIGGVILSALISLAAAIAPIILAVGAVIAVVAFLRQVWENDFLGIRTALEAFYTNTILPIFTVVKQWLEVNIPIALQTLSNFWTGTLQPAIQQVFNWLNTVLVPFITGTVVPILQDTITAAIQTLSDFWTNTLMPAITTVYDFIVTNVVPLFQAWIEVIAEIGRILYEGLVYVIQTYVIPYLKDLWEQAKKQSEIMKELWSVLWDKLKPAFDWIGDKIGSIADGFGGLSGAVQTAIGYLGTLRDTLSNISIPDILTPGSPTPFELGIRGITTAVKELNEQGLPGLTANLNASGDAGARALSSTTNNFNLSVASAQSTGRVSSDFGLMRSVSTRV